ncbi:hypothetical protein PR202_ga06173 [Eleusine coracana subsp. coracana]|uniref:GDSL esterase/lipase EXL3 n=1 Tax=Eleusine coracana subsp. coracana TaxID=191504 RepID=A0AAV5BVF2_ELECO|nr:hypothetical protein PR202_ga06173 [Eleusine coracana subsp. coracana]
MAFTRPCEAIERAVGGGLGEMLGCDLWMNKDELLTGFSVRAVVVITGAAGGQHHGHGHANSGGAKKQASINKQQHGKQGGNGNGKKPLAPALIVFGDSIVDPGNNNDINTIIKANFPPYASRLGLKDLLPAYLSSEPLEKQDLVTGVSFASGGTGFDPLTPRLASVISMPDQLTIDDVANTYFTMRARSNYDHASYARLLVTHAAAFVEDLVHAGARRVAVIGIPPIGCVPSQRTMAGGIGRACSPGHNEIAVAYNAGLEKELAALRAKNPGTMIVFMDIYAFLFDMMMHPQSYGFTQSTRGCCGTGLLEVSVLCNGITSAVCSDVGDYLFWDSYHPTEKAYKVLADFVFDNYVKLII